MPKFFYIFFSGCLVLLFGSTCKTPEKTSTTTVSPQPVTTTPSATIQPQPIKHGIQYMTPPKDSVADITINLVGDLMCHLPQTNNARLSSGEYDFAPSFEYVKPYLQNA